MTRPNLDLPMQDYETLERIAIVMEGEGLSEEQAAALVRQWQERERRRGEQEGLRW